MPKLELFLSGIKNGVMTSKDALAIKAMEARDAFCLARIYKMLVIIFRYGSYNVRFRRLHKSWYERGIRRAKRLKKLKRELDKVEFKNN